MRRARLVIFGMFLLAVVAGLAWLGAGAGERAVRKGSNAGAAGTQAAEGPVFRLGVIPEKDIFAQRQGLKGLAGYLEKKLGKRVELVTCSAYDVVLEDYAAGRIDAAFLGSLVAVLTVDREGGEVLVKPEYEDGVSTYCGVVFVKEESAVRGAADLRGKRIGAVKTTTGGNLFPVWWMLQAGVLGQADSPEIAWAGTHDDVVREVVAGRVDAGAVKDTRLRAYMKANPGVKLRVLAESAHVPENALVVHKGMSAADREVLREVFLGMGEDAEGRAVLAGMGLKRYMACEVGQYASLYEMIEALGANWGVLGIAGPPPRCPGKGRRCGEGV